MIMAKVSRKKTKQKQLENFLSFLQSSLLFLACRDGTVLSNDVFSYMFSRRWKSLWLPASTFFFFFLSFFWLISIIPAPRAVPGHAGKKKTDGRVIIIISLLCATEFPPSNGSAADEQCISNYQQPMTFSHTARQDIYYRVFTKHYLEAKKKRVLRVWQTSAQSRKRDFIRLEEKWE